MKHQDWSKLFSAFSEAFEWALDLAGGFARAYPNEVATVERVRTFVQKRIAGDPAHIRLDDLLFTFGLIAGALEKDVRPLFAALAEPTLAAPPIARHAFIARAIAPTAVAPSPDDLAAFANLATFDEPSFATHAHPFVAAPIDAHAAPRFAAGTGEEPAPLLPPVIAASSRAEQPTRTVRARRPARSAPVRGAHDKIRNLAARGTRSLAIARERWAMH